MAAKSIESITAGLKGIIDKNGLSYLEDEPYKIYLELLNSGVADRKSSAAILHLLTSGIMTAIDAYDDEEKYHVTIRRECSLNKIMADRLALILTALYFGAHKKELRGKDWEGLRHFLKEDFVFNMEGLCCLGCG